MSARIHGNWSWRDERPLCNRCGLRAQRLGKLCGVCASTPSPPKEEVSLPHVAPDSAVVMISVALRDLRQDKGLTQRALAARSGVGVKTISSYETGERVAGLKIGQLVAICRALGCSLSEFFIEVERRRL